MDKDKLKSKHEKSKTTKKDKYKEEKKTFKESKKRKDSPPPDVEPWERTIKATIADIRKDKDFYILYFEDEDIGLGEFEEETMLLDGLHKWLFVTFKDVKTCKKALEMRHDPVDSNITKVEMAASSDFDTYPHLLFLYGMDSENLTELKEIICDRTEMEVEEIFTHDEPKAIVVTFDTDTCTDITSLTWELTKLNGLEMITAPVYKKNSILVSGLNENIPQAHLERYMKNKKRSGGGPIESFQYLNAEEAIITFHNDDDVISVMEKNGQHKIGENILMISPIYPCLTRSYLEQYIVEASQRQVTHSTFHSASIGARNVNRAQAQNSQPVKSVIDHLSMSENLELKEEEMFVLDKCEFISNLRDKNKSVRIIFDQENKTFVIKGNNRNEITEVQLEILKICRNDIAEITLSHFTPDQCQFIGQKDVLLKLNLMLPNAYLRSSETGFKIIHLKSEDPKDLTAIIDSQVCLNKKPLTSDMATIMLSGKGQKFISDLMVDPKDNKIYPLLKVDTNSQFLIMIGPIDVMYNIEKEVDRFLYVNKVITKEIPFSQGKLKYMKQYLQKEFDAVKENVGADLELQHKSNAFILRGLKDPVEETNRRLTNLSDTILKKELKLSYHGIQEFLQEQECSNKIKEMEKKNNCVIITGTESSWSSPVSQATDLPQSFVELAKANIDGAVTVRFMIGNILDLNVDVIVNPLDPSLRLTSSMSKAILKQGGDVIARELQSAKPFKDVAIETTNGHLSSVKALLHIKCPIYTGHESDLKNLRLALKECLEVVQKRSFHSIAFPAIGIGKILKFPLLGACQSLIKEIIGFAENRTILTNIYLCDSKSDVVKELIERFEAINPHSTLQKFTSTAENKKEKSSSPRFSTHISRSSSDNNSFHGINVSVLKGEINKQRTDVIVITAGKSLDLTKSKISNIILKEGGDQIQDELTTNYSDGIKPGEIATTSGGNLPCQHIFHACLSSHRPGNESYMIKLVVKMLEEADALNASSISIPALGTGKLGYPADLSAKAIQEAISKFSKAHSKTSIKSIKLVVFKDDEAVFKSFSSIFSSNDNRKPRQRDDSDSKASPKRKKKVEGNIVKFGKVTLKIKRGDITKERKCDAIVNGINENMDLSKSGQVCKALLEKCGSELQEECNDNKDTMAKEGVVITKAPNLPCKQIIHVSQKKFARRWDVGINKVLNEANDTGAQSLALPVLGGSRQADITKTKQMIYEAIEKFSKRRPLTLTYIKLVIFDQDTFDEFATNRQPRAQSPMPEQEDDTNLSKDAFFTIYSQNQGILKEVSGKIEIFIKKQYKQIEENDDPTTMKLKKNQAGDLEKFAGNERIKLTLRVDEGFVRMEGFNHNGMLQVQKRMQKLVVEAVEDHHKSLHKSIQSAIVWQYKRGSKWIKFEPLVNSELERKFRKQKKTYKFIDADGENWEIDFEKMKVLDGNGQTDSTYDAQRLDLTKGEPVPKEWEPMKDDEHVKEVELKPSSKEYKTVEKHIVDTKGNIQIKKILRIQNKTLYQQYVVKKRDLENNNPKGHQNELQLFHGTGPLAVPQINESGFNRSYCGVNGSMYGKGVYFHKLASYSVGYARPPDGNNNHYLYLARVLVGETTPANASMVHLPNKPNSNRPFDSSVSGDIFVIFNDTQAYPEYLIIF